MVLILGLAIVCCIFTDTVQMNLVYQGIHNKYTNIFIGLFCGSASHVFLVILYIFVWGNLQLSSLLLENNFKYTTNPTKKKKTLKPISGRSRSSSSRRFICTLLSTSKTDVRTYVCTYECMNAVSTCGLLPFHLKCWHINNCFQLPFFKPGRELNFLSGISR